MCVCMYMYMYMHTYMYMSLYYIYIYYATTFYREVMGLFMTNHGIIIQHIFESSDQKFERFQFWTAETWKQNSLVCCA